MASSSFDPAQLSESQQNALGMYIAVTNQDAAEAVSLLQRSEWNVQIAIAKFFDGEAPDPLAQAAAEAASVLPLPHPSPSRRQNLLHDLSQSTRHTGREPAPRVVPSPTSQSIYTPPFLVRLLLTPVNLLTRLIGGSFSLLGFFFAFLPRLLPSVFSRTPATRVRPSVRVSNPRDNAIRFAREFEEQYGKHSLPIHEGGYASAYDMAKRDLKFLLVVLLSPEHEDTDEWVSGTLLSPLMKDLLQEKSERIILWMGSVQDSEAYQVSTALNCTKFPFIALIVHTPQDSSTAMSTVARLAGPSTATVLSAQLNRAIDQHESSLDRVRSERQERDATRTLREEQNSAYERSLAQDRERARVKRETEAEQRRKEAETRAQADSAAKLAEQRLNWRRRMYRNLPAEASGAETHAIRLSIRLRSGERLLRRLPRNTTFEEVYTYVDCLESMTEDERAAAEESTEDTKDEGYAHSFDFRLVSPMPRVVYDSKMRGTVGDNVGRSCNLIVEALDDEIEES